MPAECTPGPAHRHANSVDGGGKALLYDGAATRLREGRCLIRDPITYYQLCAIEGGTLRAPQGEADDRADSFALAIAAIDQTPRAVFEVYV